MPGRVLLQQRLCWLGEQFAQRLFERAHMQNLQEPELLHPQHFGGMIFVAVSAGNGYRLLPAGDQLVALPKTASRNVRYQRASKNLDQ